MRLNLPIALRSPAFAARGLEALEPLWSGARVNGLKPRAPARMHGDAARAREIYAGHFKLEGQGLDCRGRSVFALLPPSPAFAASLHGFGWLGDLQGSGRALDRAHARALVADWLARSRHHPAIARTAQI
ncbi:MAG: heparinase, partial [Aestuariivirgaceae bacterium]|nr:heparinase [Aestuariivirgaceae bacterium]